MKYIFLYILFVQLSLCKAGDKKYYFYHPENKYGSEAVFNPVTVILNGGFDVLRNGKKSKDVREQFYRQGAENVWFNITHPIRQIELFGWKRFLTAEVFPLNTDREKLQYFPNYGNHLIGHGMKFVRLAEWYDYQKIKYPYLWAGLTSFSYAFLNEVVENGRHKGVDVDPIADMVIFNPLGMLLFRTIWAKEFFSETMPLYDWSLQPVFNPFNFYLENTGEQYVLNYRLSARYSAFFYWGTSGILGLTFRLDNERNLSVGGGAIVNKLIERRLITSDVITKYVAPETIDGAIGIFFDRNHSLLASLIITGPIYYNARLNIYPGLFKFKTVSPGFFIGAGELDQLQIGISFISFPVGLAVKIPG